MAKLYTFNEVKTMLKLTDGIFKSLLKENNIFPTTYKADLRTKREPLYSMAAIRKIKAAKKKLDEKKSCYTCYHRKWQEWGFCGRCNTRTHPMHKKG